MSALILDAGALIAIDRGDRDVLAQIDDADKAGDPVRTPRDGRRAGLARRGEGRENSSGSLG